MPAFSLLTEVSELMTAESVSFMETDKFPVLGSGWKQAKRSRHCGPLLTTTGLAMWNVQLPEAHRAESGLRTRKWPLGKKAEEWFLKHL